MLFLNVFTPYVYVPRELKDNITSYFSIRYYLLNFVLSLYWILLTFKSYSNIF